MFIKEECSKQQGGMYLQALSKTFLFILPHVLQ